MSRPMRVAVVGSGPAGVYATESLIRPPIEAEVDVLDSLPAPFGLVRYGVAPDHPKLKSVSSALHKVMESPGVRFFGNVAYGTDVSLDDLRAHYDAIVFATGAPTDRMLEIPGEGLRGSGPAVDFVAWYNGHPDASGLTPLHAEAVAVIGAGNVALDVARMLVTETKELAATDVPDAVLSAYEDRRVTDVHVIARRGPEATKFSPAELRELGHLSNVDIVVDSAELVPDDESHDRHTRTNLAVFRDYATRPISGADRRIHLHFRRRPVRILGDDSVSGIELQGPDHVEMLPVQAVIRAIGYRGIPLPGVPFDPDTATIPHDAGRVRDVPGVYVAGWCKRGATGVIGTNKADAHETVHSVQDDAADLVANGPVDPRDLTTFLTEKGVHYIDWSGWLRLDEYETELGRVAGRPRVKLATLEAMLEAVRKK